MAGAATQRQCDFMPLSSSLKGVKMVNFIVHIFHNRKNTNARIKIKC